MGDFRRAKACKKPDSDRWKDFVRASSQKPYSLTDTQNPWLSASHLDASYASQWIRWCIISTYAEREKIVNGASIVRPRLRAAFQSQYPRPCLLRGDSGNDSPPEDSFESVNPMSQVREMRCRLSLCLPNLQEFLACPLNSFACSQCAEMPGVVLNRRPKAEICEALLFHALGNLPCFDHGASFLFGKLAMLPAFVQKLDLLFASERLGVLLVDEIAGVSFASLPEVADVRIAGVAIPLFDADERAFHRANLQQIAPESNKKRLQNAYSRRNPFYNRLAHRSSKPMVAGSIPAGCVLEITLETASIQASMAILPSKLLANGCARKCTKTHEIRQVFDKRPFSFPREAAS